MVSLRLFSHSGDRVVVTMYGAFLREHRQVPENRRVSIKPQALSWVLNGCRHRVGKL